MISLMVTHIHYSYKLDLKLHLYNLNPFPPPAVRVYKQGCVRGEKTCLEDHELLTSTIDVVWSTTGRPGLVFCGVRIHR